MQTLRFGERRLVALAPTEVDKLTNLDSPFAILLAASSHAANRSLQNLIETAVSGRCVEFCCIGAQAEQLHDSIDEVLEEGGLFDVVTTWHTDEPVEDALHYFVHVAGSAPPILVAVLDEGSELLESLKRTAAESAAG